MYSASASTLLDTVADEKVRGRERLKAVGRTVLRTLRRKGGVTPQQLDEVVALAAGSRFG